MNSLSVKSCERVLFIGAHCDHIEIGCGGTIAKLLRVNPSVKMTWVVLSSNDVRRKEVIKSADQFSADGKIELEIKEFRNGFFPYVGADIKEYFEELKARVNPDLIFTHYRQDLHQDHRVSSELTWNTFRDHLILEYEIPKYDGGLGSPNAFVAFAEEDMQKKLDVLMACYSSESNKAWFSEDTFKGLARLRGVECNSPGRFAEAFYANKLSISV